MESPLDVNDKTPSIGAQFEAFHGSRHRNSSGGVDFPGNRLSESLFLQKPGLHESQLIGSSTLSESDFVAQSIGS